jgi:hypothetical protein
MFTDTMESDVMSKQGNKYAQVFATQFGWTPVYPMAKKSNALHYAKKAGRCDIS